jgi:hypothetical protein
VSIQTYLSKDKLPYPTRKEYPTKVVEKPISYIANAIMERSLSHYGINPLYQYLSKVFGEQETERLMKMYHVGTSISGEAQPFIGKLTRMIR